MRWIVAGVVLTGLVVAGCSASRPTAAVPTTAASSSTTTTAPPRKISVPDQPCDLLAANNLTIVLPGAVPIVRPVIRSATSTSGGCSWRVGGNALDVEVFTNSAGDPFRDRAAVVRNGKAVSGLGDRALESDNLANNDPSKRIVVLVGSGNAAIEVTARVFGQMTLDRVEYAAQMALSHLTGN
jgi:hypothetical protein